MARRRLSFRKDTIQRFDNMIIDLACLRVDLPSLSGPAVVEALRQVQTDLIFIMEGFRDVSVVPSETGVRPEIPVVPGVTLLPSGRVSVSGGQEGKGQIAKL